MYQCNDCSEHFDKRSTRDSHKRKMHVNSFKDSNGVTHYRGSNGVFKCLLCDSSFDNSKSFNKHLLTHGTRDKNHIQNENFDELKNQQLSGELANEFMPNDAIDANASIPAKKSGQLQFDSPRKINSSEGIQN